ncbi:MAG: flagellar basal body rod protein FlgB [Acidobacteriota bacterium]|jgi:flagellar basal-body rod protein FlgB|nr:flagellar basal body rod protein FlgB [Acidobacteriota bacterium]
MYLDLFGSKTLNAMEGYLGRLSQRQQIVASNLANIDTPGYKTKDISFHATIDELLTEQSSGGHLRMTRERHIEAEPYGPTNNMVFEPQGLIERADKNNVDIDWEMMKLSETSFGYSMMTQLLRGKYQKLSTSINEGSSSR